MTSIGLVSLEEHFYSQAVYDSLDDRGHQLFQRNPGFLRDLQDIDGSRLSSMDESNVACQVISHGWQTGKGASPDTCRAGNDELATRIKSRPDRFAAFAVLPMADPGASAAELDRCVKQLGFVGALVDNHVDGRSFDGPEYDVLWSKATELDVPIYLHPALAPQAIVQEHYSGQYPAEAAFSIAHESWGWHSETGLHLLKLIAAGVFDRHTSLKIILGHFGEMMPYMLERAQYFGQRWNKTSRSIMDVWEKNIYVTTSGVWSLNPFKCLIGSTKIDHVLYSVDWPYTKNTEGRKWFQELASSGILNREELEMVAHVNAESLLKLRNRT